MANTPFNWACPFCNRAQTVVGSNYSVDRADVSNGGSNHGHLTFLIESIVCANDACKELSLKAFLHRRKYNPHGPDTILSMIKSYRLEPASMAKPQPDYIPLAIRNDYLEACVIRELSPKASATLARRCLQGMIRDFCGITENRLIDEIKKLKALMDADKAPQGVTAESIEAIDNVRTIGNIGAHMEKDINVIVDVDAGEAEILIHLIEDLFQEWYVARNNRKKRFEDLKRLAEEKTEAKEVKPKTN